MTAEDLLEVARWLADDRKTGSAKLAYRRRSISTSYDAVFHALARLCADELIGDRTATEWETVYRSVDHAAARNALQALARETADEAIVRVAGTFFNLWLDRRDADYGTGREFSRSEADSWVDFAGEAIAELARMGPSMRRQLVVRLLFKTRPNR